MTMASKFRRLLAHPDMIIAPGAYDAISARTIEQAGFPAVYMTGGGTSCALGFPDYGLLTMTEMVNNAAVLVRSITLPLIADCDTGYGNELNVTRAVREYESCGVAAIHIEDQVSPKRCGHLEGKELISVEEYLAKIRAAVAARRSPDFVVIARTDACAVTGLSDAIERVNAALGAGADVGFVEGMTTIEDMEGVPKRVRGPCILNLVEGGKTPLISMQEAQAMGYKITILPGLLLVVAIHAFDTALAQLALTGRSPGSPSGVTIAQTFARFGAAEWDRLRAGFIG
jgi:2-methylisocitrate lyase-like PEP mutase family enzyme